MVFMSPECLVLQCEVPNYTVLDIIRNFQLTLSGLVTKAMYIMLLRCELMCLIMNKYRGKF